MITATEREGLDAKDRRILLGEMMDFLDSIDSCIRRIEETDYYLFIVGSKLRWWIRRLGLDAHYKSSLSKKGAELKNLAGPVESLLRCGRRGLELDLGNCLFEESWRTIIGYTTAIKNAVDAGHVNMVGTINHCRRQIAEELEKISRRADRDDGRQTIGRLIMPTN